MSAAQVIPAKSIHITLIKSDVQDGYRFEMRAAAGAMTVGEVQLADGNLGMLLQALDNNIRYAFNPEGDPCEYTMRNGYILVRPHGLPGGMTLAKKTGGQS